MYKPMYNIHRFRNTRKGTTATGVDRLITPECVIARQYFEQSNKNCFEWLSRQELAIFPVVFEDLNVTLYVVGTTESAERFKIHIGRHLCNNPALRTQNRTGLYERFVSKVEGIAKNFKDTNVWMEATGGISREYLDSVAPVILFTADRFMAIRLYLELSKEKLNPDNVEATVFDKVYCFRSRLEQTVIGVNEDDTITVRNSENNIRLHKDDVWHHQIFPLQKLQAFGVF